MPRGPRRRSKPTVKTRIRIYCAERDITQGQLAREVGLTESHLSQIVGRRTTASLRAAIALEDLTGIPAREFTSLRP